MKLDVLRKNAVRTDKDVNLSLLNLFDNFLLLFRGTEATDHLNGDGKCRKAALEGLEMLEGQNRRGRKNRHLAVVLDGLKGRAHRDLCLAVADVSAEQPIHWHGRFHVLLNICDRRDLIVSF